MVRKSGKRCGQWSAVNCAVGVFLATGLLAPSVTFASRVINSVKLNGGAAWTFDGSGAVVTPGDGVKFELGESTSISVEMTVTTAGGGDDTNDWESTAWRIATTPPGSTTCANTANFTADGPHTTTFTISAPTAIGVNNAYFWASAAGTCSPTTGGGASPTVTLANSIVVSPPKNNPKLSQACGLDIAILIDMSGSIATAGQVATVKAAAKDFADAFLPETPTTIGVVEFSDGDATTVLGLTGDLSAIDTAIDGLSASGFTNWEEALLLGAAMLEGGADRSDFDHPDLIVMFTDGDPTASSAGPNNASQPNVHLAPAVVAANAAKNSTSSGPIRIVAIGVSGASQVRLMAISGVNVVTDGNVTTNSDVIIGDFSDLGTVLGELALQLCGGTVTACKIIDENGLNLNANQDNDQTPGVGWHMDVTGATSIPDNGDTGGDGCLVFEIDNVGAVTVDVCETPQAEFDDLFAFCTGATNNGVYNPLTQCVEGVLVGPSDIVSCKFFNTLKTGACCDRSQPGGLCTSNVLKGPLTCDTTNPQISWYRGEKCVEDGGIIDCPEHIGACCDRSQAGGLCTSGVPESACDTGNPQISWYKGLNCVEDGGPIDCPEHTGACCDHAQPGGDCADNLPESFCFATRLQPEFFKGLTCADVETLGRCEEHTGACCDHAEPGGTCTDGVAESVCYATREQGDFFKGLTCADVEAFGLCQEHTGACCDRAQPGGVCTDNVFESVCNASPGQPFFFKGISCTDLELAGLCTEHTGACCDHGLPGGACIDDVAESVCMASGDQPEFFKGLTCTEVEAIGRCEEHRGACCDASLPGGVCTDNLAESECFGPQISFFKGLACADVEFLGLCPEHTGACCDHARPGGFCLDGVPGSVCYSGLGFEQPEFFKDETCAAVEAVGLCLEHTGACCDAALPGGQCTDNVAESVCMATAEQPSFFKGIGCAAVEAGGLCPEHTGACCDHSGIDGECTDGVAGSACTGDQLEFFKGSTCAEVEAAGLCLEHTGACCDHSQTGGGCTDGVRGSLCFGDQLEYFKGMTCAQVESSGLCEEHTGACCDHELPGGVCTSPVAGSVCLASSDQAEFFKGLDCALVEASGLCMEHTGACCDRSQPGGLCTSNVPESLCNTADPQVGWYKGLACIEDGGTIDCPEHTGACCDQSQPGGVCTSNVPESLCNTADPQVGWFKGAACLEDGGSIDCPEHTGACCDHSVPGGSCQSAVPASGCDTSNPQIEWFKGEGCLGDGEGAIVCAEHSGACCDRGIADPGDRCRDDVAESLCVVTDPTQQSWTKGTSCDDLAPSCTEHVGACCDRRIADSGLRCRNDVPESECVIDDPDQVSWYKFTLCAELGEPCLEHTGACCDGDVFGTCQDDVPASQCNCNKCSFHKDTPCGEIVCTHNTIPTVSQWGLVVLTLLLLTGAKVYFGRRSGAASA